MAIEMAIEMTDSLKHRYSDLEDLGSADRYMDEILEIVHQIGLFDDLNEAEVRLVCRHMRCYGAPRNYIILQEGLAGDGLLLVLTGAAREVGQVAGEQAETEVEVGAALGATSFIDGKPHLTTCITSVPMDFAVLSRDALNIIQDEAPRLGNKLLLALLKLVAARLRIASRHSLSSIA
ncbi:MAG: cyclic nucleotide-binding domain-containing protein [Betaproteobacteria bacterium HGW-Betaproteobacteria-8]|nr:MAG: cyclic nucleotide-binding domain-containing protein [Betaproteobacteria bacterium HGW-Betaproteobacteria-8]